MDKIEEIYQKIEESDKIPQHKKTNMLNSMKHIITNGTLIDKKVDDIKKHNYRMQISLDGPKDIHD
jgi:sulfatase maturation enzyme AslB (radical SAM superfamily)